MLFVPLSNKNDAKIFLNSNVQHFSLQTETWTKKLITPKRHLMQGCGATTFSPRLIQTCLTRLGVNYSFLKEF